MNTFASRALVAIALSAAIAAPAAANVQRDVQQSITEGNVNVSVRDSVATLTGESNRFSKGAAERAALKDQGVDRVINLINVDG